MTKDEALKKAFKQAFQLGQDYWYQADHEFESQNKKSDVTRAKFEQLMEDAIKEALAQPEPEYLAFMDTPQRKPLTDEEIDELRSGYQSGRIGSFVSLARAIEAAHGIKGEA